MLPAAFLMHGRMRYFEANFRRVPQKTTRCIPANILYQLGGISNSTIQPLLQWYNKGLDDLVAKYGQDLQPNQLIPLMAKCNAMV